MSEHILSQEEMDALLSAMNRGEVDLKQEAKSPPVIEEYCLTTGHGLHQGQFDALDEVHDRFTSLMNHHLADSIQRPIEMEFVSTETIKYGELISSFSNPCCLNTFGMEPLIGSALLAMEPALVFSLIDCMFGGIGRPINQVREFTLIERHIIRKFAQEVLRQLQQAWAVVCEVRMNLKKMETKPEFVRLAGPGDTMISIVFALKAEAFSGNIHLGFSQLMLEPIRDKLCSVPGCAYDEQQTWSTQLLQLLEFTPVTVVAELGKTVHTVGEVLSLQVDDVLHLDKSPKDNITVTVDGVPKFFGYPGVLKGNRAVEIARWNR